MKTAVLVLVLALCLSVSCGEKSEQEQPPAATGEESVLGYTSEEFSFGVFFDAEATQRTITLEKGQTEIDLYIMVHFPEGLGITATEFRLDLPDGVEIMSDDFYAKRTLSLGGFDYGLSEAFPCVYGPMMQLHRLTLHVDEGIRNGVVSLLPVEKTGQISVAICDEQYTTIRASSYKGVINPTE